MFCAEQYETKEQAVKMRELIDGVEWPPNGRRLHADFSTEEEAAAAAANKGAKRPRTERRAEPARADPEVEVRPEKKREAAPAKPTKRLDDLFNKTTTKPAIYWVEAGGKKA